MTLPKLVAAAACLFVLGTQIVIAAPFSPERHGWYWPFLAYPMYAESHARTDSLLVSELHVAACGSERVSTLLDTDSLAIPRDQLLMLLVSAARGPESTKGRRAEAQLGRAVEAQYPARYCTASAWIRVVRVADSSTYRLDAPMRIAATWPINAVAEK
jgi:hypothetical protein